MYLRLGTTYPARMPITLAETTWERGWDYFIDREVASAVFLAVVLICGGIAIAWEVIGDWRERRRRR
jgi:hypothetical protein